MSKDKQESRNLAIAIVVIAIAILAVISGAAFLILNRIETDKEARESKETSQKIEQTLRDAKASSKASREKLNLAECIDNAQKSYEENWNNESASLGMNGKLPMELAELHDKRLESAKDDCYRQYD